MNSSTSTNASGVKTLGDFISLQRGTTYKSALLGQPGAVLIGLASIEREGGFCSDKLETYGGECPPKISLKPGDLYVSLKDITHDGHLLGAVARIPDFIERGRLTQDTVKLVFEKELFPRNYIYWLLRTPQYRNYCRSRQTGTTNLGLSREDFLSLPVPPMTEATNAIVIALESIERKIENLRRQNETLERIAQTLFKHWFVDFEFPNEDGKPYKSSGGEMVRSELGEIPAGWRVGNLGEIALFNNGKSPPARNESSRIPIFGSNGIIGNTTIANNQKTVIIGRVGSYCGSLYYYLDQCWVTDNAITGRLKKYKSHAYLYLFLGISRLNKLSGGSGQPLLNQSILSSIELAIPDGNLLQDFEEIANSLFKKILLNQNSIRILTETHDVLLPQLMSGKLRITIGDG